MGLRVCVFEKMITSINADLFKHAPKFIQTHVNNHEKVMKNQSRICQKSIRFNPWVVLERFRCQFAPRSALGGFSSFGAMALEKWLVDLWGSGFAFLKK